MSENKSGNSGVIKIIVGLVVLVLLAGLAYAYFSGSKNSPLGKLIPGKQSNIEEFNYTFKFDGNVKAIDSEGKTKESVELNIGESQIYSSKDALKQRLMLKDVTATVDKKETFSMASFDYVGDRFKNYIKIDSEAKEKFLQGLKPLQSPLFTKVAEVLGEENTYVMTDNEKAVLSTIGDLAKNDVIKELFLANGLSNPMAYLQEKGTLERLKKEIKKDAFLDYMFVAAGEPVDDNGKQKQFLSLNDKVCSDYLPFFNTLFKQISASSPELNISNIEFTEENCKASLVQANSALQFIAPAYKIGDIKGGNYDFVMSANSMVELKAAYKSHTLTGWNISASSPDKKQLVMNISGDENGVKTSLLKVDYTEPFSGMSIKGEIKDGNGELVVDSKDKENGLFGQIVVKNYYLENIDVKGLKSSKEVLVLKGKIVKNEVNLSVDFDEYGEASNMVLVCKDDYLKVAYDTELIKGNFLYDHGKITGFGKQGEMISVSLKGDYKNLRNFDIRLQDDTKADKNYFVAKAETKAAKTDYKVEFLEEGKKKFDFIGNLVTAEKEGSTVETFIGTVQNSEGRDIKKVEFNFELAYKKGGATFEIPKNFKEVEIGFLEMYTFPAMNPGVLKEQYEQLKPLLLFIFGAGAYGAYEAQQTLTNNYDDYNYDEYDFEDMDLDMEEAE